MLIAWLALPGLALLLLAAHFVHAGLWVVAVIVLALVALLGVRRPWAVRTLQLVLLLGVVEWLLTAVAIGQARVAQGQPYLRMLAIMGTVALLTAAVQLVFRRAPVRAHFGLDTHEPATRD